VHLQTHDPSATASFLELALFPVSCYVTPFNSANLLRNKNMAKALIGLAIDVTFSGTNVEKTREQSYGTSHRRHHLKHETQN